VKATACQPFDPAEEAASELRIRMAAAFDCFARAKDAPPVEAFLHRKLAQRHAEAVLGLLSPEALKLVLAKDAPR
jgi:hypothetical protein